jgi:hypothetical protein
LRLCCFRRNDWHGHFAWRIKQAHFRKAWCPLLSHTVNFQSLSIPLFYITLSEQKLTANVLATHHILTAMSLLPMSKLKACR